MRETCPICGLPLTFSKLPCVGKDGKCEACNKKLSVAEQSTQS